MYSVLQISRSTYYYEAKESQSEDDVTGAIVEIFEQNRSAYGTRKIKVELHKRGFTVSRRRIDRIVKEQGLVSPHTVAQFKPQKTPCNESAQANELKREFEQTVAKSLSIYLIAKSLALAQAQTKMQPLSHEFFFYSR
ncbi:IS3 family transposase [Paenibacillus albidus]|nr:IS3 family transposase [Paenibacillus albidus]